MDNHRMLVNRRRFLAGGAVLGAWAWTTPGAFAEELVKTPAQTEGPFYPDKMPLDTDNDLLILNDQITPAVGTITHLTGEVLTRAAGIQMQHSPYKTIVDATGDVFDGRIQMVFDPSFVPYAKAGKVRAVLTDGPARLAELPDVPTAREVGLDLKGFRDRSWFGLFAPKGTPPEALKRISDEAARAAAQPDLQQKLLMVAQTAHHQSVEQFAQQVASDKAFFAALIKDLNLKLE